MAAARPRKILDPRSGDFATRFAIHLRKLMDKRKLSPTAFRDKLKLAGVDFSGVTIEKWMSGDRLPRCHDLPVLGKALSLKDYRHVLPE